MMDIIGSEGSKSLDLATSGKDTHIANVMSSHNDVASDK